MKLSIVAGSTSQSVTVFVQNSASTTGAGLTGLVFNTSGLIGYYTFGGANTTAVAITLATLATVGTAYGSGGFIEVDSTHMPGIYRLDLPNAAIASAKGRSVVVYLSGAASMAPCVLEIELTGWDNQDAVHGGMSALPNTACSTNASLITSGAGTDQLSVTSGVCLANLKQILGTALTETAGQIAGAFKAFFNVAAPSLTCLGINQTGDSYARLGAPVGASISADVAALKTDLDAGVKVSVGTGVGQINASGGKVPATIAAADVSGNPAVNAVQFGGQTVTAAAGVTVPASIASPTNITAGTITNVTNAPTAGDFTATMKTSLNAATPASVQNVAAQTGDAFARLGAPTGASVSADIAAAPTTLLDAAAGIESGWTLRQGLRMFLASMAGLLSGAATTTVTITNPANTKNRITATVDANGNRSAITYDVS